MNALRDIAAVSRDHLVSEGPVHPDYTLLGLCAEALHLARQARSVGAMRRKVIDASRPWTDTQRAEYDGQLGQEKALNLQVTALLKQARRLPATTPAGVYAKALLVQLSCTGAAGLAQTLAADLIACEGLRQSLTWPDTPG